MTDRELLEKAAQAAGIQGEWCEPIRALLRTDLPRGPDGGCEPWNALADDGDALRLAVKLEIVVTPPWKSGGYKRAWAKPIKTQQEHRVEGVSDPDAATRRAIVLAAAAMAP